MALIKWSQAANGTWTTAADWTGGVVPGPNDTAVIDASGRAKYTVSVTTPVSVGGLVLDAKNATLSVDSTFTAPSIALESGTLLLDDGTLAGTLSNAGGTLKLAGTNDTLQNVTCQGSFAYTGGKSTLTISGGLTLTGAGGVGRGSAFLGSHVVLDDVSSLNNAAIRGGTIEVRDTPTLTLGSGLSFDFSTLELGSGSALVNDGVLANTLVKGGTLTNNGTINGQSFIEAARFVNDGQIDVSGTPLYLNVQGLQAPGASGVINVSDNGTLVLVGSETTAQLYNLFTQQHISTSGSLFGIAISGTLNNSGATLDLGTGTQFGMFDTYYTQVAGDGVVSGGTIVDEGGNGAISGTFSNLTLQSENTTLSLGGYGTTDLDNVTVSGATTLAGDVVFFNGGTLSGVGTLTGIVGLNGVDITGVNGSGAVTILASGVTIGAAQSIAGYDIEVTGGLTLMPGATLDSAQLTLTDPGGTESLLYANSQGYSAITLGASLVTTITSGTTVAVDLEFGNVTPLIASMGTIDVAGTLQLGTGSYIGLDNSGTIALSSSGSLFVSSYSYSEIMNEGTITSNAGAIDITTGMTNSGLISDAFGGAATTLAIGGAITGAGTIALANAGTLALGGTVAAGQVVQFGAGAETLDLTQAAASMGFSGTLDGFAKGDAIVLSGEDVSSARFSGTSIVATLSSGGSIVLATGGKLRGSISVTENSGNATLTYASSQPSLQDWSAGTATQIDAHAALASHEAGGVPPRWEGFGLDLILAHRPWH